MLDNIFNRNPKLLSSLLLVLSVIALPTQASNPSDKPNVILIVADYMGYADIEPYGAKDIKTPALSALASQGIRFTDHYSAAPKCIPARAALMSGLYPPKVLETFNFGRETGLNRDNNTLLKELKATNYTSALIGKWHLGMKKNFNPIDHGFDYFFGFNSWTLGYHNHLTPDGDPGLYRNNKLVEEDGYLTDIFTAEANTFIEDNAAKPFFLYLSYSTGLPPYQRPDLPEAQWNSGWNAGESSRDDYIAMVEAMDNGIGRVLRKLEALNLIDNTLVIFTYDHGGRHLVNSEPLFHGFGTLWEGGIRVPLIMRWPNKIEPSKPYSHPTIAMDVTATVVDAIGKNSTSNASDGINLISEKTKLEHDQNRTFFWRQGDMKAVRQGRWKYVIDDHTQLLFNLDTDVGERKNLFSLHTDEAKKLAKALADWEESL